MARLVLVPEKGAKNVIKLKEANYIRRKKYWQRLFWLSIFTNIGTLIFYNKDFLWEKLQIFIYNKDFLWEKLQILIQI